MTIPVHISQRGGVYQYVRRVPDELVAVFGCKRIQKSLRTRDEAVALSSAAKLNDEFERQVAAARGKLEIATELIDLAGWTAEDWTLVARWFEAQLIHEDLLRRLPRINGAFLSSGAGSVTAHWSDRGHFISQIGLLQSLEAMTVADYLSQRLGIVNAKIRPLGVCMLPINADALLFASECLKAELKYLEVFQRRERAEIVDWPHPQAIAGRWKPAAPVILPVTPALSMSAPVQSNRVGRTLGDCQEQWKKDRQLAGESVRDAYVTEMTNTINDFETTQGITDIGEITRKSIIAYRAALQGRGQFEIATINKKTSFITALLATAASQAWIDNAVKGNIHLKRSKEDENKEPYSKSDLSLIFEHEIFREGKLAELVKAGAELQFWLPLISCTHGMISSEIVQLGPDTICKYPDEDVLCFNVTNAGGRHTKELSRRRYVPIRRDLLDLGLMDLVDRAATRGWRTLWSAVEGREGNTDLVASMFSAFWSKFNRKTLKITDEEKTLYSFRHSFKDAMKKVGASESEQNALMGHAEAGTGRRYGTKRAPPPAPINQLSRIVQSLNWEFLPNLVAPKLE